VPLAIACTAHFAYFDFMDRGELAAAREIFRPDAQHVTPAPNVPLPGYPTHGYIELTGIDAIFDFWTARARPGTRHDIFTDASNDVDSFVEGFVSSDGVAPTRFMSHLTVDADGLIRRFIAMR
jgi:hypothetical protein